MSRQRDQVVSVEILADFEAFTFRLARELAHTTPYPMRAWAAWFDPASSTLYRAAREWNGRNRASVITGDEYADEYLYRTRGGRWVLNRDTTRYDDGGDRYEYVSDTEARDWLVRSQDNEAALAQHFGPVEEERAPGRPAVGDQVNIAFPADLLAAVDAAARASGVSRSEWVRRAARAAL